MPVYKGKTVDDAIEKGLKYLQIDKEQAKITVLKKPRQGLFGKIGKQAKVEITQVKRLFIVILDHGLKN